MSQLLIQRYLNELETLRRVSGTSREQVVREAFKTLLKDWGRAKDLIFIPEYEYKTALNTRVYPDGALLYSLRVPLGYWEAKDDDDDLDAEIAKKFRKGYPQDNILFEDSREAVLIQNRQQVIRCPVDDPSALQRLLELFFSYERQEIAQFRKAVVQFQTDLPAVLAALRDMIEKSQAENTAFRDAAGKFLKHAQETINPAVTAEDVREMLIQHILTEEIFSKVFDEDEFHRQNNVAKELYTLEGLFFTGALKRNTMSALAPYYNAIRATAHQITTHKEKQTFLKVIYEGFYKVYNRKAADRLGVVYTPGEIVRFMIESADWLCQKHFGKALIDEGVDILDPATGTGTFICELLEHFRGQKQKLAYKYKEELHANEVAILPYYVANLNIEATYAAIMGQYAEFPNLCFVDTLDNTAGLGKFSGHQEDLFGSVSEENVARIKRQNARKISVIIGNPPYNANQQNENDNNKNRTYPRIDQRIKDTYVHESKATRTTLYDMYVRFYRWASDRLSQDGIVAFITNRSFIESRSFDGFREILGREFSTTYVIDLGGDVRANPKLSGTRHNVFGIQTGVAIQFLIKQPADHFCFRYFRRPEFEIGDDKLAFLNTTKIAELEFQSHIVRPNDGWIKNDETDFGKLVCMASRREPKHIFDLFSTGVMSGRDEWVYAFDFSELTRKMGYFSIVFTRVRKYTGHKDLPLEIKWSRNLIRKIGSDISGDMPPRFAPSALFRPFLSKAIARSDVVVDELGAAKVAFAGSNILIAYLCVSSANPLAVLAADKPVDYGLLKQGNGGTQAVYRYRYTSDGTRLDNITDWALGQFRDHYGLPPSPLVGEAARRADEGAAQDEAPAIAGDALSGVAPSSAGFAGTFSREGRRGAAAPKQVAIKQFAKTMRAEPTPAEKKLWTLVRDRRFSGFKFRRQVPIGDYIADFVCFEQRLIVEADGSQHGESASDPVRDAWFASQGFRVRRFWNADILARPTEVTDTLWADLAGEAASVPPPHPPFGHLLPRGEKEGSRAERGEITKDAIFHYVYAVLHDPVYRETYAQNLKREFPRIPFYRDFWRWADWGERLMGLHIGYETVERWPLERVDAKDEKAAGAMPNPKVMLKADRDHGIIVLDSQTQLSGVPPLAWTYRLGNRSALDWILDQHKEKTPKDPTIREKFNTYRFADHKEKVVDLLMRVTRVSVETMTIVDAMRAEARG